MAAQMDDPAWKVSLRKHHMILRTGIIIDNILPALRPVLTPTEYSRVAETTNNVDRVDELVKILLTKDDCTFERFCSVLESNGYSHWASKLKGKGQFVRGRVEIAE